MAGRKNIPTKLKILKGTARKSRLNPSEPDPDTKIPTAPNHLSKDALIEWGRISTELSTLGLLSEVDMVALAMYCQAWGRIVKYEKIVQEKSELIKMPSGAIQLSPAMWIINKAMEQCYKLLSEFGMSPASRAKVSGNKTKKKQKDSFEDFG